MVKFTIKWAPRNRRGWECRSHLGEYAAKPRLRREAFPGSLKCLIIFYLYYKYYSLDNFLVGWVERENSEPSHFRGKRKPLMDCSDNQP